MTDDVIHSTQYYVKYLNRAIFDFYMYMLVIFSSKNVKRGHKLELTYSYAYLIIHSRHHLQI